MNTKRMKNDQSAVSPVIATILMVAITVVLAGVLLILVTGISDDADVQTGALTVETVGNDLIVSVVLIPAMDLDDVDILLDGEIVDVDWDVDTGVKVSSATGTIEGESGDFVALSVNGKILDSVKV